MLRLVLLANGALRVLWKARTVTDATSSNGTVAEWGIARGIVYILHSISAVVAVGEGRSAVLTAE
jgi:hypothetical protein